MTRNEAIAAVASGGDTCSEYPEPWLVDALVALGVLKLDAPKLPGIRLYDAISATPLAGRLDAILAAIDRAGLKLVDK